MITIRPATGDDCRVIWEWRNDPAVRAASFNTDPIPWDHHREWFVRKLADPSCRLFIVEDDGKPVGQVRFDIVDRSAEVHISLAEASRGRGVGAEALRLACALVHDETAIKEVIAQIAPDNRPSMRAFQKAGFVDDGLASVGDQRAHRMLLNTR